MDNQCQAEGSAGVLEQGGVEGIASSGLPLPHAQNPPVTLPCSAVELWNSIQAYKRSELRCLAISVIQTMIDK